MTDERWSQRVTEAMRLWKETLAELESPLPPIGWKDVRELRSGWNEGRPEEVLECLTSVWVTERLRCIYNNTIPTECSDAIFQWYQGKLATILLDDLPSDQKDMELPIARAVAQGSIATLRLRTTFRVPDFDSQRPILERNYGSTTVHKDS